MTNETLTSRLNFSDTRDNENAIEISKWGMSGFYETRLFIGTEISAKYHQIARERIVGTTNATTKEK